MSSTRIFFMNEGIIYEDVKVKIVDNFEDIKNKIVEHFEGVKK